MSQSGNLSYSEAERIVLTWADYDHDSSAHLTHNGTELFGTLGALDFQYVENSRTLYAWGFVGAGVGPLLTTRAEVKQTIDKIAREQPEETAHAVFDIRTLAWNQQAGPELEPCLYLRLDISNNKLSYDELMKRLKELTRVAYIWHKQKMLDTLKNYWARHPEEANKPRQ